MRGDADVYHAPVSALLLHPYHYGKARHDLSTVMLRTGILFQSFALNARHAEHGLPLETYHPEEPSIHEDQLGLRTVSRVIPKHVQHPVFGFVDLLR